jgi:hypothetical protein
MLRNRVIAGGLGVLLFATWLTQTPPYAEAASAKARNVQPQKPSGGDKGVAWISGAGGVRGYAKGGNEASRPKAKAAIRRGQWIMDGRNR